ncbi:hypothetical protein K431DRAFT_320604 [Polychaeton citri CBS 116435]|uniref:Uncharacterized protein n=1 Tax=Polychaeton citri CBS 116435 TaxID=1314669 RepID=A0A9P4UNW7_9PEZI|nr:hypothetical protein K431DRAFT_320604 [Polychaeton citri CBS 116435]
MKMHDERTHPLLQQTALSVNPYLNLPSAPTLPHNYASLPSTLPPSIISAPPATSAASGTDLPAYVTSSSGFAAHPSTLIQQNEAMLRQLQQQKEAGRRRVAEWENNIRERELAEKRRKAPGWLDSENRLLQPEKKAEALNEAPATVPTNLMDEVERGSSGRGGAPGQREVDDLGAAMDRAFGPHEMG